MKGAFFGAAAVIVAVVSPAYAARYESDVSAYSDGSPINGQRYFIVPADEQKQANSFEFAEFARHVERALSTKGLLRVGNAEEANVIVLIAYGIGNPKIEHNTYQMPIVGQTGVASSSTSGQVSATGKVAAATTNTPIIGVTGYKQAEYDTTTFDRHLQIAAVDVAVFNAGNHMKERWRVDVKSSGSSDDLRLLVPVMAYSSSNYVGTDTGHAVLVKVKVKSKEYLAFLARPVQQ